MEAINEVNELLTTKLCSPVIVFGVVAVVSLVSVFLCHRTLKRYNTQKMENLRNLCTTQEIKYLIILGVTMFGLCQYNKTDLAWIFLIFPVIYIIIQNSLLYIHLSSAVQNAPQEQNLLQAGAYGLGMQAPLLASQGSTKPEITKPEQPKVPTVTSGGFEYAKPSNGMGASMAAPSWDSAF
tara:strand:- start:941 stop:1483 length:543 start_codon:yes stop_codon:yes gene_type:complete